MRQPRVVFVNGVYPPQAGATGALLSELAADLAVRGWRVEVVAGGAGLGAPDVPGVAVTRVAGEPPRAPLWRRTLAAGPFWLRLARASGRAQGADVVVFAADPPLLFLAAGWVRRRTGAAVVHWAQDLYPDVAHALGVPVAGGRGLRLLAARALRRCDAVVAIGRGMAGRVAALGVAADRVAVVPNWPPPLPDPPQRTFRDGHGLAGRFVVMYSGTMGLAHPYGALLDAAAELAATDPEVAFVVAGGGTRRATCEAEAVRRGVPVTFVPTVPAGQLADSLGAADLHLVTMDDRLAGLLVPSKVYGALAAGRPVLFLGPAESEAARLIADAQAGTVLPGATGADLAAAVRTWKADPARRAQAGARARVAVAGARARSVEAFAEVLQRVSPERG